MFCTRAYLNVLNISVPEILQRWGENWLFSNLSFMVKPPLDALAGLGVAVLCHLSC